MTLSQTASPLSVGPARRVSDTPQTIRDAIRRVVTGLDPWPLLLTGGVGTGKTCAALCLIDRCLFSRRYFTTQKFVDDSVAAMKGELWSGDYRMNTADFWRSWREAEITCLDELGSRSSRERVSDHHYETIKRAIDERNGEACIWISNLSIDELARVYDDRIASRLAEGTQIVFGGRDRRIG